MRNRKTYKEVWVGKTESNVSFRYMVVVVVITDRDHTYFIWLSILVVQVLENSSEGEVTLSKQNAAILKFQIQIPFNRFRRCFFSDFSLTSSTDVQRNS